MKRFLTIAATGLTFYLMSCNNGGDTVASSSQGEKNIATSHAIDSAITSGDVSKLDQYIAADGVDHSGEHGDIKGLDSIKASLKTLHDDYKDMKLEAVQSASNGDYVFELTRFIGTSVVASMGAPAGTSFDMTSVNVTKFNSDGKATDHWEYMAPADMMKMMGGGNMNEMDNKMKKDTMKKN